MTPPATLADLEKVFGNVVQDVLAIGGVVLFIMLILGGLKFITSGGDPKAAEGAQKTITYAIGGLLLILVSYLILVLIHTITGVDVLNFTVVQP
jgi:hypothetical protein